jgi:hypothetical protein
VNRVSLFCFLAKFSSEGFEPATEKFDSCPIYKVSGDVVVVAVVAKAEVSAKVFAFAIGFHTQKPMEGEGSV